MDFLDLSRNNTRRERYDSKASKAISLPAAIATVSFDFDDNIAFTLRAAACLGLSELMIIGVAPSRSFLNSRSGSLYDYIKISTFTNPVEFNVYCREMEHKVVAVEMTANAVSLHNYSFSFDKKTVLVLGNETTGVPGNITETNDTVFIPMFGSGYCLNTSQAGVAAMYEYSRQFSASIKH